MGGLEAAESIIARRLRSCPRRCPGRHTYPTRHGTLTVMDMLPCRRLWEYAVDELMCRRRTAGYGGG